MPGFPGSPSGGAPQSAAASSTIKLQAVVDFAMTIGDLSPVLKVAGYTQEPALTIANDVMSEMLAQPFAWKWNRIIVPPFVIISQQQDYAGVTQSNIGWLENAAAVDINNTSLPKPLKWLECVRDLQRTSAQFGTPNKICWKHNLEMVEAPWAVWPGAGKIYSDPVGAVATPTNGPTNILDASGNILVLTVYGTTGLAAPNAGPSAALGTTVADGTCQWAVASARAQGFRLSPLPPQNGPVWQIHVVAQARPGMFTALNQTLGVIPDDFAKYFRDGFIAYCHRHSSNPAVRQRFEEYKRNWRMSLAIAQGAGTREKEDMAIVPATSIMEQAPALPAGAANPYGPYGF